MKRISSIFAALLMVIGFALTANSLPQYTGFTTRSQGYVIQNTDWNGEFGNLITFMNQNLIGSLNLLLTKGNLLSSDGTNVLAVTNNGASDNGKFLTLDSTQTVGMKWASLVSGVTALTTLGDTLVYGPGGITRMPVGANGTVLTSDSTAANGVSWGQGLPSGSIVLWYGAVNTIPTGYSLCNGQTTTTGLVTPNLQGVFVCGAGNTSPAATGGFGLISPNTSGGAASHNHGVTASGSANTGTALVGNIGTAAGTGQAASLGHFHSVTMTVTGNTDAQSNAPTFLSLCYIMKN